MTNLIAWEILPIKDPCVSRCELLKHLTGWGILAPNAHNAQPWKFIVDSDKNSIKFCVDPRGILAASDKCGRQATISVGCAIANIIYASKYFGLSCNLKICESLKLRVYPEPMAELIVDGPIQIREQYSDILMAIKRRSANRSKYDSLKDVPLEFQKAASVIAQNYGATLFSVRDMLTKIAISEIQFNADQFVMLSKSFRQELGRCIIPNDTCECIGMPGNTLGLGDETTLKIIAELKRETPTDPDLLSGNSYVSRDFIKNSPLVGILAGQNDTPYWWIIAGLTFGQIAIEAEIKNVSIAIHAAMIEVGLLNKLLKLRLLTSLTPLVIFRAGYATEARPHSPRLDINQVLEIQ